MTIFALLILNGMSVGEGEGFEGVGENFKQCQPHFKEKLFLITVEKAAALPE